MTLLDEYLALPEKARPTYHIVRMYELLPYLSGVGPAVEDYIDLQAKVIRLLTRALREARPCVHYTAMDMGLDGECSALLADVDALLSAVERDLKEGV